jgi:hypothetical protein
LPGWADGRAGRPADTGRQDLKPCITASSGSIQCWRAGAWQIVPQLYDSRRGTMWGWGVSPAQPGKITPPTPDRYDLERGPTRLVHSRSRLLLNQIIPPFAGAKAPQ